jgi:hypothetical protein
MVRGVPGLGAKGGKITENEKKNISLSESRCHVD